MKKIILLFITAFLFCATHAQVSAYTFSQSTGTYTAIAGGVNMASTTSTYLDAQVSALSPIGFTFNYNGLAYTQFGFSSDGCISLGSTPSGSTTAISSGTSNNIIAAMNADLIGRGALLVTTTSGSAIVTVTGGDISLIIVGDAVSGSGVTTGSTVVSKTATTITLSAAATTSGSGRHMRFAGPNFGVRYETIGSAPNRKLVVQWTGFGRFTTSGAFGELYNFQIVLNETSDIVNTIYNVAGPTSATATTFQVGLRGNANTDFNNRSTITGWSATTAGATNAATVTLSSTVKPVAGLTYAWTPPACIAPGTVAVGSISANSASVTFTSAGSAFIVEYGATGFTPGTGATAGTGGTVVIGAASPIGLTGLTAATAYDVYVRQNCTGANNGYSFNSVKASFTTTPACPAPTTVTIGTITTNSASVTFTGAGSAFIVEYGATGFTPGTGAAAGTGGTVVIGAASPIALTGLSGSTSYDVYVRQDCTGLTNGYSLNSLKATLYTGYCVFSSTLATSYVDAFSTTGGSTNISNLASGYSTGGYGDFTAQKVVQNAGSIVSFSITGVPAASSNNGYAIYVDYNNDLTFSAGEMVYTSNTFPATPLTSSFTIPLAQPIGTYRLRLVTDYNSSNPAACGAISRGEAEDYLLQVTAAPPCAGPINGGTATSAVTYVCSGSTTTLNSTGTSSGTGLTYQWQSSPAGANTFTNISGATTISYTTGTISSSTDFRLVVTCSNGPVFGTSTTVTLTIGGVPANDLVCNAIPIVLDGPSDCGNTTCATATGDPTFSNSAANNTVWYTYTPASTGVVYFTFTRPAGVSTGLLNGWLGIFTATGTCPGALTFTELSSSLSYDLPNNTTVTVATPSLTAGAPYYFMIDGVVGAFGAYCIALKSTAPAMTYVSSTTTQSSTSTVTAGSSTQQIIRLEVSVTGTSTSLTMSQIDFNTIGSTLASDISNAKVFYTGTSTTFSTTNQFGSTVVNPSGAFSVTGTQALTGTLSGNATNYFWLVYDVACGATVGNVVDASATGFILGGTPQTPTITAPTGNRTIISLYAPTRTDANGTTAVQLGTQNAQFVYALISGATACSGTVTAVNFTATNPNASDITNAKAFYTTTSTFSNAVQFGSAISNPASGALSFTGSQALANGNNYFWVVYDINCNGTVGAVINADINSLVVNSNTIAVTGTVTGSNTLAAVTSFTTVADGEWNNLANWSCGNIPLSNSTAVTIANNITVSTAGNIGGSVTINSGKTLTISAGGDLTLGTVGGGNSVLTNNGTLLITGGTLNQNGSIISNSGSIFNQSGGNINIDGNAGGVIANSVASGTSILQFNQLNTGINLTGGTLTIVDPHAATTASNVITVYNFTPGIQTSTVNHTLILGNGTSTDPGGNSGGFIIDPWNDTEFLSFGNIIVNGGAGTNRVVTNAQILAAVGDLTINANSSLNTTTGLIVGKNLLINSTATIINSSATGLIMTQISSNSSSSLVLAPVTQAQSITNNGILANAAVSTANLITLRINNSNVNGVTLNSPISVSGTLTMTAGRINTTTSNLLTLGYNATNAGTLSYTAGNIVGPFKRWITAATGSRVFPMGDGVNLKNADINFTTAPGTAGTLTAKWSTTPPNYPNGSALTEGLLTVTNASTQGSWFVDAADGLAGGLYTSTFTANGSTDIIDFTKTVLIKRPTSGGNWTLDGTHVTTTGSNTAPVLRRTGMSGFSEFAIGGTAGVLPVAIEYFRGSKVGGANYLDWKITCTSEPSVRIILERSADSRNFKSIQDQTATAARCAQGFNYTDAAPLAGINYYRLKTISPDGAFKYSVIVALLNKDKGFELISVAPNPVKINTVLSISTVKAGRMSIAVSDMTGKVVMTQNINVIAGNNPVTMNFATLSAGTYNIKVINADNEVKTTRFVKY